MLAVALLTGLVFVPALSAGWVWDDEPNFLQHDHWRGLGPEQLQWMGRTTWMGHYQPLSWITLGLNYVWGGLDPVGYHAVNVLLHATSSALFVAILARLAPAAGPGGWAAGALFFAVHPLRVESVVWITERRDVLAMALALGALLAWLEWVRGSRSSAYTLVFALYVASLLAKAHAVTLPAVLLLLDAGPLQRLHPVRHRIIEKLPFFLAAILCSGAAIYAQHAAGALYALEERSLAARLTTAAYGASMYPGKFLVPIGLSPAHAFSEVERLPVAVSLGALAVITTGVLVLRRRTPALGLAWVTYLLVLLPVSGLLQAGPQALADRYTYFSGLPFAALVALGVGAAARRWRWSVVGVAAWILALGVGTWRYAQVWQSSLSLWSYAYTVEPDNPYVTTNLAAALEGAGRLEEATRLMAETVRLSPDERAGYRYGRLLHLTGHDVEAEAILLEIPSGAAFRPRAACLVANIREARGDWEGAERARVAAGRPCEAVEQAAAER